MMIGEYSVLRYDNMSREGIDDYHSDFTLIETLPDVGRVPMDGFGSNSITQN